MEYETLDWSLTDRVLTLSLNRPDAMNAFTVEMAHELIDAFNRASEDDDVGAIVVTGKGKAFCAGMDLSVDGNVFGLDESQVPSLEAVHSGYRDDAIMNGVRDTGGRVSLAIFECKKPVIGAINGAAVGVGATMTLPMDIRLASDKARLGFVFGKIAVTPEACSTWFLPRLVGLQQALEWVMSADIIGAEELREAGLVKAVYPAESLLEEAQQLARKFVSQRSPVAIALARQMLYHGAGLPTPREAHEVESLSMFYSSIGDGKEGVAAFLEKREPAFASRASEMPPFYPWFDSQQ